MISSRAILLGGLLSRYESISARMRVMNKERFDLLRDTGQRLSAAVVAAAVITQSGNVAFAALVVFLVGTGALLVGVLITTTEAPRWRHEVMYESQRVLDFGK